MKCTLRTLHVEVKVKRELNFAQHPTLHHSTLQRSTLQHSTLQQVPLEITGHSGAVVHLGPVLLLDLVQIHIGGFLQNQVDLLPILQTPSDPAEVLQGSVPVQVLLPDRAESGREPKVMQNPE